MTDGPLRTSRLAKRILEHFLLYPESGDSVIGIARWGVGDTSLPATTEATQEALELLVSLGLVVQLMATGMRPIYRLKQRNQADAEAWLARADQREGER